jgi:DNA replication initiation complex subunit (GINS family)
MSQEDFQQQVLNRIQELKTDVDQKFAKLEFDIKEANIRIDAYQKSSVQVVNLAFGLISAAAAVVILSPAVKALTEFFLSR